MRKLSVVFIGKCTVSGYKIQISSVLKPKITKIVWSLAQIWTPHLE